MLSLNNTSILYLIIVNLHRFCGPSDLQKHPQFQWLASAQKQINTK